MSDIEIFEEIKILSNKLHNSEFKANLSAVIGAELSGRSKEVSDALAPLVMKFIDELQRQQKSGSN